jgi:bis(5'-nucleosidyl)-tetraphosphatase
VTGPLLAAGAVVVWRDAAGSHRYLLLRAYRNWDFPKGLVEPGEEPLAAALREVREEAGLAALSFPRGEVFVETPPYARGKVARYYLAETATDRVVLGVNPALGRPEHHEHRWLPYPAARALLVERLQAVIDWAERLLAGA